MERNFQGWYISALVGYELYQQLYLCQLNRLVVFVYWLLFCHINNLYLSLKVQADTETFLYAELNSCLCGHMFFVVHSSRLVMVDEKICFVL